MTNEKARANAEGIFNSESEVSGGGRRFAGGGDAGFDGAEQRAADA